MVSGASTRNAPVSVEGAATGRNRRESAYPLERCTPYGGGGPSAATESRLAPTPRRSRALRASHAVVRSRASLMWISSVFRRDGDGVEVDTRPPRGTVVPGVTVPGARDIERISSGQCSHLQGLGVAAHVVRSTPAHPCGAGRKSLCRADARRAIRRTGRFGRESYGGTPKSGFRPTFPPYARSGRCSGEQTEMGEDLGAIMGMLDGGDDLQGTATGRTVFHIDLEHPLN